MHFKTESNNDTGHDESLNFFSGGGEMGALMRSYQWSSHPLGDPSQWPTSLKNSIQLILSSAFPMFLWWSKDLYMFHNDPYIPALGEKHPDALGASARVMWAEIWDSLWGQLGGNIESILIEGRHFYAEDLSLFLKRRGFLEETFWTFSYSPAFNDDGSIGGMFCSCYESTKKVLGQRRLNTIKDITAATSSANSLSEVNASISQVLKSNLKDLPFAFYYSLEDHVTQASLMIRTHNFDTKYIPSSLDIGSQSGQLLWPFQQILRDHQPVIIEGFSEKYFSFHCVHGDTVETVVLFPVFRSGQEQVLVFL